MAIPDNARNQFHVNIGYLDGRKQALLVYTRMHSRTPVSQVLTSAESLDALATQVGLHYHALTNPRSGHFTDTTCPSSKWEGPTPTLRRGVGKEFGNFWTKVQDVYCERDGGIAQSLPKSNI